jgi:hypothetical protein
MRTLSKLLSAPVIAGMLGAAAMTAAVPAMARDYGHHWSGRHWSGHHWGGHRGYHHWRGHGGWGWSPGVSFGFYGGYPYYGSDYGYYGRPYYCNTSSWYYNPDYCYGSDYYGYYGGWYD